MTRADPAPGGGRAAGEAPLGAAVSIHDLSMTYGSFRAVDHISMAIAAGELVTILGPSGSGKTTTMMAIAGFVDGYSGEIRIGNRAIDHLPPHRRDIGVVFQHLALFPHMTVADNVAFPLRMRGIGGAEIRGRVAAALDLVQLGALSTRLPGQLSGGQQQRVALARAIVFSPPVLLLDEPFGALDRKLRESMQLELKALHRRLGITIIHVTHDQGEAMAISDRIAVMNGGRVEQLSRPRELYASPRNRFVADFVGESVFLRGTVTASGDEACTLRMAGGAGFTARSIGAVAAGAEVSVLLRPECLLIGDEALAAENRFPGVVEEITFIGDRTKLAVALPGREQVTAIVPNRNNGPDIAVGGSVVIGWRAQDALVLAAD